eukprot:9475075-Pyramimonas_sp.AAC.2
MKGDQEKAICKQLQAWAQDPPSTAVLANVPEAVRSTGAELLAGLAEVPAGPVKVVDLINKAKEILANGSLAAMQEKSDGFPKFLQQSLAKGASWVR